MRILVTGGRNCPESVARLVRSTLTELRCRGMSEVVQGGATGVDRVAREWARWYEVPCITVPADWKAYGRAAGPIRNGAMLDMLPAWVVAFPGGNGTADCIRQARQRGIPVRVIRRRVTRPGLRTPNEERTP